MRVPLECLKQCVAVRLTMAGAAAILVLGGWTLSVPAATCGDGVCEAGENRLACPEDCRRRGQLLQRIWQRRRQGGPSAGDPDAAEDIRPTGSVDPSFAPQDVPVGDPAVNYANVEFTADGRYMVWFEGSATSLGQGTVWHCGVDPETGALTPPDGKGFRAFDTTFMGRANPGMDAEGSYYVGLDRDGRLVLVRPRGPTTGNVTTLPTPPDPTRRAIYPTDLPHQRGGYVFWIKNERVPGGMTNPKNRWVELQYIDLARPTEVRVIERQDRPAGRGAAPMDVAFARWFRGKASLTFGAADADGTIQVKEFDLSRTPPDAGVVTADRHAKIDPFPWTFEGQDVLLAGIDGKALLHVYARREGAAMFSVAETVRPAASFLQQPGLAQSAEGIVWDGKAYAVYQVNERPPGANFWAITFGQPGEIWLTSVFQSAQRQWRLSEPSDSIKTEPEPYVGSSAIWVFYSEAPQPAGHAGPMTLLNATWHLRRTATPLARSSQAEAETGS